MKTKLKFLTFGSLLGWVCAAHSQNYSADELTRTIHPTDVKERFEALFRFYGPEKPLFDKTWVLPVSFQFGGRLYAEKFSDGRDWGLRFFLTLVFPK